MMVKAMYPDSLFDQNQIDALEVISSVLNYCFFLFNFYTQERKKGRTDMSGVEEKEVSKTGS